MPDADDARVGFFAEHLGTLGVIAICGLATSAGVTYMDTRMNTKDIEDMHVMHEEAGLDRWTKQDAKDYQSRTRSEDDKRDDLIRDLAERLSRLEGRHRGH